MKRFFVLMVGTLFTNLFFQSGEVTAHGGNKPGPHGGNVKMPAAFHSELVREKESVFRVYLIDMRFENPVVDNSSVSMNLVDGESGKEFAANCTGKEDYFLCSFEEGVVFDEGDKLKLDMKREKRKGKAVYKYPLKFPKKSN